MVPLGSNGVKEQTLPLSVLKTVQNEVISEEHMESEMAGSIESIYAVTILYPK